MTSQRPMLRNARRAKSNKKGNKNVNSKARKFIEFFEIFFFQLRDSSLRIFPFFLLLFGPSVITKRTLWVSCAWACDRILPHRDRFFFSFHFVSRCIVPAWNEMCIWVGSPKVSDFYSRKFIHSRDFVSFSSPNILFAPFSRVAFLRLR